MNKPSEDAPADYGPFKIVHVPSGKPWFVSYPDGSRKRCAGLWGVAKLYLIHHSMEVTDEKRREIMKHIEATLGKTRRRGQEQRHVDHSQHTERKPYEPQRYVL